MTAPTHRARQHLEEAGKRYPNAWRRFDEFRQDRIALGDWPEYVYCPLAGAYALVSDGQPHVTPQLLGDIGQLGALAAWRPTQGIYRFDPDLYAALWASPLAGTLPCDLLRRLPAWGVYLETDPAATAGLHGFFAHLEFDPNDRREELRLLLDTDDGLVPMALHLGPWDLATACARADQAALQTITAAGAPAALREAAELAAGVIGSRARRLAPLVSLVLYLASEEADYERAERPQPKRTKRGWRLFPAEQPATWPVGVRIGAALRRGREVAPMPGEAADADAAARARPRPHIRAAHWHLYWTGPREGARKPLVKWLPPIPVNLAEEELPAVIRRVAD